MTTPSPSSRRPSHARCRHGPRTSRTPHVPVLVVDCVLMPA
nr:MAG TPA: hypothetical protein [Caudoviricetes sp.]